jgi:hypothetical protein
VGVFVTPCLSTNFKATAVKKLHSLGPIFTAAPGNWGGDVGSYGRSAGARGAARARGGAGGVSVALGSPLARADVPWVPMGSDPTPPTWLQTRGGLKRPLGRLYMHGTVGGLSHILLA